MNKILKRIAFTDEILSYEFSENDFKFRECLVYNKSYMFNVLNNTKFDSKDLSKIFNNSTNPVIEEVKEKMQVIFYNIAKEYVLQNKARFGEIDNVEEFVKNFKYIIT